MITLLYHEISDNPHWLIEPFDITISPKTFEYQMNIVKDYDVQITFDDGYKSAVNYAGDILAKYNLKSIWLVNSGFWDNEKVFWLAKFMMRFPSAPIEVVKRFHSRYLDFVAEYTYEYELAKDAQLYASPEELKALNAEIGNHTVSHPNMKNVSMSDYSGEIGECNKSIFQSFGIHTKYFAFPFGEYGVHWDLNIVQVAWGFPYKQVFSTNDKEIHGVSPRYIVPNIDTGFREYLKEIE